MTHDLSVEAIMAEVEQTKPSLKADETYQELVQFLLQFPREHDSELYDMRLEQLRSYVAQMLQEQKLEPLYRELPISLQFPSGIHVGQSYGRQVYLPPQELVRNWELAGTTGSGKTNTLLYVFSQLPKHGIRSWIIDLMHEYQVLQDYGYEVIPADDLRLNPLHLVPGNPRRTLQVFARIFAHSQSLLYGSRNYFRERVTELFDWFQQYDQWPTLEDVRWFIAYYPEKGFDYKGYQARTLVRLNAMLQQDKHILDVQHGFAIDDVIDKNIVFDLRAVADETQVLIAECIMAMLYEYYMQYGVQDRIWHVLGMDEARHVWNKQREQQEQQEQPYNIDFLNETRKFGIGAILASQEPTHLSPSAAAATHIKSMLQLTAPKDMHHMADALQLDSRQRQAAQHLQTGEMILKLSNTLPSLVQAPRFAATQ